MKTIREKIDYFSNILNSYITTYSNNPETKSNIPSIETLIKLKTALDHYTVTIKELIAIEDGERKDKRCLSLSCATVISRQVDSDIIGYIGICWQKDGNPCSHVDTGIDVISWIEDIMKVTKDMEKVLRKYKWATNNISDAQ